MTNKLKLITALLSLLLAGAMLLNAAGCMAVSAAELTEGMLPDITNALAPDEQFGAAGSELAVQLLKNVAAAHKGEGQTDNLLLSPLSAWIALAMAELGAKGETLAEFERFSGGIDLRTLCGQLEAYADDVFRNECIELTLTNSLWLNEDAIDVQDSFLRDNVNFFRAQVYRAPFDRSTVRDVNHWAAKYTGGRITHALDELPADTVMLLVNALLLDAKWNDKYNKEDLLSDTFNAYDGRQQTARFMKSSERYIVDEGACGIVKPYQRNYSDDTAHELVFAALMPDEGIDIYDYIAGLTGERLRTALKNDATQTPDSVRAFLPKFKFEFGTGLKEPLIDMGLVNAFDPGHADFTGIEDSPLYLGDVIQKTFIEVDELGTRAGAVSIGMMQKGAIAPNNELWLNRPFVFVIYDLTAEFPLFIGALTNI